MEELEKTNDVPQNEDQADALIESVERPSHQPIQDAQPQTPVDEYKFTVGGKEITANRDKLIRWAQQGYDAPTRIGKLTQDMSSLKAKYDAKETSWHSNEEKYGQVDAYVRENPQFWDHVVQQWQQKQEVMNDQSNPLAGTVSQLQKQMQDIMSYKDTMENQQQAARVQQEDAGYMKEFEDLKTAYPQIDFSTPSEEDGKSLEYKVLEYANENGIKKFTTAFRDFHHDELMKIREEQGKEKAVKEKQKNTRLGILGTTYQPTKQMSTDVKGKSWNQIAEEAKAEYGI